MIFHFCCLENFRWTFYQYALCDRLVFWSCKFAKKKRTRPIPKTVCCQVCCQSVQLIQFGLFFLLVFLANITLCFNYYYRIKRQCITFFFFPDYWIFCYRYVKWRTILFLFSADETHRIVCTNVYLRCMMYECRSLAFDNNCWWTSHLFFVNLPSRDIVQPWHTRSGSVNTETEIVVSSTCRRRRNNKSLFFLYILQRSL